MAPETMAPEMQALKSRLKATWESGDYGHFAKYLEPGALDFLSGISSLIKPGTKVLDVACGAGQTAIPLAKSGAHVTGIDLAENLVAQAKTRASEAGLTNLQFEQGDAEALPVPDASFDVVMSLIGAMFAPRANMVAAELARVCKPGGMIIIGNWTPEGFIGQMFKTISKHVPPSPLMDSPVKWGDQATVLARFSDTCAQIDCTKKMYPFKYPFGPGEVVDFFAKYYGPTVKAFGALDEEGRKKLKEDLDKLWSEYNEDKDGGTVVWSEYLEVRAKKN